ncbi:hypothetical protein Bca4012_063106 [Brassica carinata]|uniref:Leucine-rich repeat-containing N-terminal plant-type domain-containing protein n=1 Tax=Brassica carinata TaxID=52824 RepID=A0A8X7SHP4_BRACI|nr:hypothetical protein Bca52824_032845 [Brassica carinata]
MTATAVTGDSMDSDSKVLLNFKSYFESWNPTERGMLNEWKTEKQDVCQWPGITYCTISGPLFSSFSSLTQLTFLDLSSNTIKGSIPDDLSCCHNLKHLNLSLNIIGGELSLSGLSNLEVLDLLVNKIVGDVHSSFPLLCNSLVVANLSNNNTGRIDDIFNECRYLKYMTFSTNKFSRDIPETLLNLRNLLFLDLSKNNFGGDIQEIFGRFTQVKYLVLHGNLYVGGIYSSNILTLPNLSRLDLSYNNFSGWLPSKISQIQTLDLSFNRLTGSLPDTFGKLTSLLWLMLANNSLSGEIPREIGNCSSLLWFNVENNQLSGGFHPELTKMGSNPILFQHLKVPSFHIWIRNLYKKSCRSLWDHLLKSKCIFPVCPAGSMVRLLDLSGYLQLSGNKLSGEVPANISQMKKLSMLHLGFNEFQGKLPIEIGQLPLVFLNLTRNQLSVQIPQEIGNLKSLQNLDLSYNNFSRNFPTSLDGLSELSKFNISYNPFISGVIPSRGQLATLEKDSFLENPLLQLPSFFDQSGDSNLSSGERGNGREEEEDEAAIDMLAFYWSTSSFNLVALIGIQVLMYFDCPWCRAWLHLVDAFMASLKSMLS